MASFQQVQLASVAAGGAPTNPEAGYTAWYKADSLALSNNDPVSTWADSSANAFDLTGVLATRPLYITNQLNTKPIVRFDGTDDLLTSTATLSQYISNSAATIYMVFKAVAVGTNNAFAYQNDGVFADTGQYIAFGMASTGPTLQYYNYDGSDDQVTTTFTTGTYYIVKIRHAGGNIIISVNGGSETTVASGNTQILIGTMRFGTTDNSNFAQIDVAEIIFYNTSITASTTLDYLNGKYAIY